MDDVGSHVLISSKLSAETEEIRAEKSQREPILHLLSLFIYLDTLIEAFCMKLDL